MKTKDSLIVAILFIAVVFGYGLNQHYKEPEKDSPFVIIGTLFTGLAFAFLVYTARMQKDELELQRKELKDTRAEFEQQNNTMKRQRFESSFFNLLNPERYFI